MHSAICDDMRFTIRSPYFRRIVTVVLSLMLIVLTVFQYRESSYPKSPELTEKKESATDRTVEFGPASDKPEYMHCRPVRHVMFLKTHKCASTTVQNILLRYGYQNNLTFVIPPFSNNLGEFDRFEKFHPDLALPLPSQFSNEYQIFAHHARFNEETIPRLMPHDTIYISILRKPSAMYHSVWKFFSLHLRFGVSLEEFTANPRIYYFNQSNERSLQFGRNPIMSDFGLEKEDFDNLTAVQELITYIEKQFALVMISDQMDESLVLLRKLLCWKWEDVVAFHLNRQSKGHAALLSVKVTQDILAWNNADQMLYQHFLAEFEKKKVLYGKKNLYRDVKLLRALQADWEHKCFKGHGDGLATQANVDLVHEKCQFMCMDELEFTDRVRGKQWPNYGFQSRYRGRKNKHSSGFGKNYCDEVFT